MTRPTCRTLAVVALTVLVRAGRLAGQGQNLGREFRVDAVTARRSAIEGGLSIILPAGVYVRNSLTVAAGVANRSAASSAAVGRAEILSRFLLDPFRESPYGLSVGGGVGFTNLVDGARWRPYLAAAIDLELKAAGGFQPAVQLGLGGGARLGVVLRKGSVRWR